MNAANATQILVMRHGHVAGSAHVFRGQKEDLPLSEAGHLQMQRVLEQQRFDRIASSPLQRCREPALQLTQQQGLPLDVLSGMAELDFGDWDGLAPVEVQRRWPTEYAAFRHYADAARPPQGESLGQFRNRVRRTWNEWTQGANGGRWLLLTHAGVMRVLLQQFLDLPASSLYRIALSEAAHFEVSLLPGHPPILMSLQGNAE